MDAGNPISSAKPTGSHNYGAELRTSFSSGTGVFEAGDNSLEGKFFAETAEDAANWSDRLQGQQISSLTGGDVPLASLAYGEYNRPKA
jgi:hypothetical protein